MKVRSSAEEVKQVEVAKTTVYIRTNIVRIETDEFTGWEYDEEQITKDDFIENLQKENEFLKIGQAQTSTTLLELMEVVLLGGI